MSKCTFVERSLSPELVIVAVKLESLKNNSPELLIKVPCTSKSVSPVPSNPILTISAASSNSIETPFASPS